MNIEEVIHSLDLNYKLENRSTQSELSGIRLKIEQSLFCRTVHVKKFDFFDKTFSRALTNFVDVTLILAYKE